MPKENEGIVGERIIRNFPWLFDLYKIKSPKKRWIMVKNATRDQLMAIIEICVNIHAKDFILTPAQERKLGAHMDRLAKIRRARKPESVLNIIQTGEGIVENPNARRKRDKIKVLQRGSGLLASAVVPVIMEVAGYLADKYLLADNSE